MTARSYFTIFYFWHSAAFSRSLTAFKNFGFLKVIFKIILLLAVAHPKVVKRFNINFMYNCIPI